MIKKQITKTCFAICFSVTSYAVTFRPVPGLLLVAVRSRRIRRLIRGLVRGLILRAVLSVAVLSGAVLSVAVLVTVSAVRRLVLRICVFRHFFLQSGAL